MGSKPLNHLHTINPFTTHLPDGQEVNGNTCINLYFVRFLLPSALADGFGKFQKFLALAPCLFLFY